MGVCALDIAYARFRAPDLERMESFLRDFGLVRAARTPEALYMRGTDDEPFVHVTHRGEPGFVGLGFVVEDAAALETLAGEAGAGPVAEITEPGGGAVVRFTDPNGFRIEAVAGRASVGAGAVIAAAPRNDGEAKARLGHALRLAAGPAHVKRLGHCVINVADFRESEAWYKQRFGLITSDEIMLDANTALGAFLRCDRGGRHVDHHTLFLVGTGAPGFNHAAFEVANFDDLMTGHAHLKAADHRHEWGVGRHILGSQIFDYWRDPWGHMVEHWTDGDVFDSRRPPARHDVAALLGVQWGAPHPG